MIDQRGGSQDSPFPTAVELGHIGSKKAFDNTESSYTVIALESVKAAAHRLKVITVDNVWAEMEARVNGAPLQRAAFNGSALGAVMTNAAKLGAISNSGTYQPSVRPSTHGRPVRVWKSLIYNKETQ